MSYKIFSSSLTAYAEEVMDDYYWVGQGDRLPMSDSDMSLTSDKSLNIGSATHVWKKLYSENLYVDSSITSNIIIRHIASVNLSASALSIEFTGLTGNDKDYAISIYTMAQNTASAVGTLSVDLIFNGDSASNYNESRINLKRDGTLDITSTSGETHIKVCDFSGPKRNNYFYGRIYSKTGTNRVVKGLSESSEDDAGATRAFKVGTWSNTSDEITSIKFNGSFDTETRISIWEI